MATGFCPECDSDINVGSSPRKGQRVTCRKCGAYLVILSESPIELDWADDEFEDIEYDDSDLEWDDDIELDD